MALRHRDEPVARHRRTEARRWRALARLESGVETADDNSDRVVDTVTAAKLLPDVVSAISRLAATDRDALLLHVWEHLTYEEVAAALGIPVGTVRSRINRARTKLRELTAVSGEQLIHADVFTANKERLMTTITGHEQPEVFDHRSRMYPRLAYRTSAPRSNTSLASSASRNDVRPGSAVRHRRMGKWATTCSPGSSSAPGS